MLAKTPVFQTIPKSVDSLENLETMAFSSNKLDTLGVDQFKNKKQVRFKTTNIKFHILPALDGPWTLLSIPKIAFRRAPFLSEYVITHVLLFLYF